MALVAVFAVVAWLIATSWAIIERGDATGWRTEWEREIDARCRLEVELRDLKQKLRDLSG
jgi:hypothetical protein